MRLTESPDPATALSSGSSRPLAGGSVEAVYSAVSVQVTGSSWTP